MSEETRELIIRPIGYIQTPFKSKYDAPHQPGGHSDYVQGTITLLPGMNFEQALADLAGMEKIWLLYWFDRNTNWKPKVQVPRGERVKRGLFATRSPHRPNPIGLTLVDLLRVDGLKIEVGNIDLLDGTPILDIKPYLPYSEAHPDARSGWIEHANEEYQTPTFAVEWSSLAMEQLAFLEERNIRLREHTERLLARDPSAHPYRRIEREGNSGVLAVRAWRIYFEVAENIVTVARIGSGYDRSQIEREATEELSDGEAQKDFASLWS